MLGVNQLDFINYCNALKGNYRKGVHKMETLLENPTHAKEFANNLGGVSVVLGTPVGKEDRNSETLRSMLLASDVANDAVYTWMGQFYEFSSWDDLLSDASRCNEIMNDPLKSRAVSGSGVAVGKMVATIAGLSCSAYADMSAVAASSTAMAAVASSQTARAAIEKSQVAKDAIAASDMATAKYAVGAAGLKPADYANMAAVAASQTAMAAVANNKTALTAVINNASALNTVVSSSTAMTAIASSQTAMAAVASSQTAMAAVINNSTALNAVVSSSTAMTAIASSQTAMAAIATSSTAMSAISASTTAINALKASPLLVAKTKSGNNWTTETVRSGRGIAVYIYGASVSGGNGWVKTDNVQTTFSSNGTNQNLLKAFQTSLSVYWYQNSSTLYYIPC